MFRSLRTRLFALLAIVVIAACAIGVLMIALFQRSTAAQVGQMEAEISRACEAQASAFRFYAAGWHDHASSVSASAFRDGLEAVVQSALRDHPGIEGGLWREGDGSLAYAYPTYEGAGPKTDLPQAEAGRIEAVNEAALAQGHPVNARYAGSTEVLLLSACPLPGPLSGLTAWTMTRVRTLGGHGYQQLMIGLGLLLATVLAAVVLLTQLTMTWSRHISRIEATLAAHDVNDLPRLPATGERELDRIVRALNEAGDRLAAARQRAEGMAREMAASQRLAAIGRITAGVAHEIRNPIAAMRLKAENALAGDAGRREQALTTILDQIDRLDLLLRRLLSVTERDVPDHQEVALADFLDGIVHRHADLATARGISLSAEAATPRARFDPEQMGRALDNLILNAVQAAPQGTTVRVRAHRAGDRLVLSVRDQGDGPPPALRDDLFEPFVTGRAEGTGLGLSIVREIAVAHDGIARFRRDDGTTTLEMVLPWQPC
ncbi:HAMP domain-containing sensor histidine kinase [Nitrospirillum sp. BR 11828]|uniref:sensor histidine kinase n=1 Tax=Nitrospirillum sp. BR 11828 TaxID=3104325 RepID=UPI002ACA5D66|nr:HAMP domain-containing sensor histidine kinase [Nitrospirillum sp. BR 11828]MDZ5649831.1 HAMP domain-containing sensor histidine kinase [Nitrospirillum sp. BR 11828]